ncbi:MAG: hypothetical protein ACRD9R_22015 [Pyrinomonadaceae bacterium]
MESHDVPTGTHIMIGAAARGMPQAQAAAIADMLSRVGGVTEAHLPQCFVPGVMDAPAQVLTLVLAPGADADAVMREVGCQLGLMLPEDQRLDVWPIEGTNPLLEKVRIVGCRILGSPAVPAKPWWRLWR